jgi:hypothetical protein
MKGQTFVAIAILLVLAVVGGFLVYMIYFRGSASVLLTECLQNSYDEMEAIRDGFFGKFLITKSPDKFRANLTLDPACTEKILFTNNRDECAVVCSGFWGDEEKCLETCGGCITKNETKYKGFIISVPKEPSILGLREGTLDYLRAKSANIVCVQSPNSLSPVPPFISPEKQPPKRYCITFTLNKDLERYIVTYETVNSKRECKDA